MYSPFHLPLALSFYVLAAVLPTILLLYYIYRNDTIEKEPPGLLASLLALGAVAAILSGALEGLGERMLVRLVDPDSLGYTILLAFLVIALIEEGAKFLLLKWRTWSNPNFNYRFDGIVYAVFISLGFAAYENIQYVLHYGLSVALPRALLAVPGHLVFSVLMGYFYGRAKLADSRDNELGAVMNLCWAFLVAVLLHGFYDTCAMVGTTPAVILFAVFVLTMYLLVYRLIKRESAQDMPV